jgi:hypothetical protein
MYHEEMQVKFEYGCCLIITGEVIALGLRKPLENDSFCSLVMVRWFLTVIPPEPKKNRNFQFPFIISL